MMRDVTITVTQPSGTVVAVVTTHDRADAGNITTCLLRRPVTVRIRRHRPPR